MASGKNVVKVGGKTALSSPSFIVEQDGRFYVTVAVVEYDLAAATTPEQKKGVEQVGKMFKEAQARGSVSASPIEASASLAPMNTGPSV